MGAPFFDPEHVDRYRETDGETGHDWQATTMLLLTPTGHNSNAKRTTPLIYHADDYLVVASNGGDPPGWFVNLHGRIDHRVCRPAWGCVPGRAPP
jgi:hypothetical protein